MKENSLPLISVIVPVYNVEQYLNRCVDSIINQIYYNLEIILIDDGSTDNCGKICDKYAKQDDRIVVIHKENGGLSDARNAGLEIMSGEYVTCIDSDDFVSAFYVQNLYDALIFEESEIACSVFLDYYENDKEPAYSTVDFDKIMKLGKEDFFRKMLYQDGVEISACGKLYVSKLFEGIRFPVGKLYEDVATTYLLIEKAKNIAVIPNIDYCYFHRKGSIAQSKFNPRKMDAIIHMKQLRSFIELNYPELRKAVICRCFSATCNIFFLEFDEQYSEEEEQLWNEIKKYRKIVLFDKDGRKKARLAALLSYFGKDVMAFIYQGLKR